MHTKSIDAIRASRVPYEPVCGVYFLFMGDALLYIGQSIDVHARLSNHRKSSPFVFDSFHVEPCHKDKLNALESIYINTHLPPENTKIPGRKEARAMGRRAHKKYGVLMGDVR